MTLEIKKLTILSPYDHFVYALNAYETKRQYPHRLDKFLSFIGLEGIIQEKCNKLFHTRCSIYVYIFIVFIMSIDRQMIKIKLVKGTKAIHIITQKLSYFFVK